MPRFAIVNQEHIVENIILWDGASAWEPPDGRYVVQVEEVLCNIGWQHDNGEFKDPNPPAPVEETPAAPAE